MSRNIKTHWFISKEGTRFTVRQEMRDTATGKKSFRRYPREKYKMYENDLSALEAFVKRINEREFKAEKAYEAVKLKHAFIDDALLADFEEYLRANIPSKVYVTGIMGHVKRHFIGYFVNELHLKDPVEWHRNQVKWARYLQSNVAAPKTKRAVVQAANRFIGWLSTQRPDVPKVRFEPISRAVYSTLIAEHAADDKVQKPKMIEDADWDTIKDKLPKDIAPFVLLGYHYGLRRGETLAMEKKDVKNGYLAVERQISSVSRDTDGKLLGYKTKILKGKLTREVPHWFCKPVDAHKWAALAAELRIHPDTLGQRWAQLMRDLGLHYTFHDLRHTWVTKAIRKEKVSPRDVQLAAGHKNIETTMGYLHDDRQHDDEEFNPEAA
jgi:integrase